MANRYFSFEELKKIQGYHKPGNTRGVHHMVVSNLPWGAVFVTGNPSGVTVEITPGETLGYDCGRIWVVPAPNTYKDPIRRFLAETKISQRVRFRLEWTRPGRIYRRVLV